MEGDPVLARPPQACAKGVAHLAVRIGRGGDADRPVCRVGRKRGPGTKLALDVAQRRCLLVVGLEFDGRGVELCLQPLAEARVGAVGDRTRRRQVDPDGADPGDGATGQRGRIPEAVDEQLIGTEALGVGAGERGVGVVVAGLQLVVAARESGEGGELLGFERVGRSLAQLVRRDPAAADLDERAVQCLTEPRCAGDGVEVGARRERRLLGQHAIGEQR